MNYFKSSLALAALLLLLSPVIAFAASYPASCPAEAQAIVNAVGGCSAIDPDQYSSIYEKCCSVNGAQNPQPPSEPTFELEEPATEPSPEPTSDTPSSDASSTSLDTLISILVWGGLIYFVVWFVRKLRKKKGGTQ